MIVAMISFYDEDPRCLSRCVNDLAEIGVDHIVVVDGAYDAYPRGQKISPGVRIDELMRDSEMCGIDLDAYDGHQWSGNEVEKRQFMLDRAIEVAGIGGWLVIWDADYQIACKIEHGDVSRSLSDTHHDVACVSFTESSTGGGWHPMAMFMRAILGTVMDGNHHTYLFPDGRRSQVLRRPVPRSAAVLDMSEVLIYHGVHERDPARRQKQTEYYEERERLGLET